MMMTTLMPLRIMFGKMRLEAYKLKKNCFILSALNIDWQVRIYLTSVKFLILQTLRNIWEPVGQRFFFNPSGTDSSTLIRQMVQSACVGSPWSHKPGEFHWNVTAGIRFQAEGVSREIVATYWQLRGMDTREQLGIDDQTKASSSSRHSKGLMDQI